MRINVWKKKNPRMVRALSSFFLKTRTKVLLHRTRESTALVSKFLRDALNSGERYKKMKIFRAHIIRFQQYVKSYIEVQRCRLHLMKVVLDRIVLEQLNKLKKEKAVHEQNAVNKLKYKRDFGPTVVKIQKITQCTNNLLNISAAHTAHFTGKKQKRPTSSASGNGRSHPGSEQSDSRPETATTGGVGGLETMPSLATASSVFSSWYPGSSFSGFGVDAGGKPSHPKYTSQMVLRDLKSVLANQRRRHYLAATEYEANAKAMKGVTDVGLNRVKDFLKTAGDIGPMVRKQSLFELLYCD